MNSICAKNLDVAIKRKKILKGINITANVGDWVSIIGANGAGKSTLLRALAGWHFPYQGGEVLLNDVKFTHEIRKQVTLTPSPNDLPLYLTGRELIDLICRERAEPLHQNWPTILETLDGEIWYDRPLGELSWGTLKKVCIGTAICTSPKILLMDESFDGLDATSSIKIRALLANLVKRNELGILCASHSWESVFAYSNIVYFIKDGEIIKCLLQHEFTDLTIEAKRIEQMVAAVFNGSTVAS